jgi:hypothetical protein
MTPTNPLHLPETEFTGELQEFSGQALAPDDPRVEQRVRKGRPADREQPPSTDTTSTPPNE